MKANARRLAVAGLLVLVALIFAFLGFPSRSAKPVRVIPKPPKVVVALETKLLAAWRTGNAAVLHSLDPGEWSCGTNSIRAMCLDSTAGWSVQVAKTPTLGRGGMWVWAGKLVQKGKVVPFFVNAVDVAGQWQIGIQLVPQVKG